MLLSTGLDSAIINVSATNALSSITLLPSVAFFATTEIYIILQQPSLKLLFQKTLPQCHYQLQVLGDAFFHFIGYISLQ